MKKKLLSIILIFCLIFSSNFAWAVYDEKNSAGNIYLAFTSDVHNGSNSETNNSAGDLRNWINNVSKKLGNITFDSMVLCGDYASASANETNYWKYAQRVYDVFTNNPLVNNTFFVAGNHETTPGNYIKHTSEPIVKELKMPGEKYVDPNGNYILYSLGATNNDINGTGFETADVNALRNFFADANTPVDVPIFIISHFPLHEFVSQVEKRHAKNRESVIEILNEASDNHKIFFVWGHNHSQNDPQYDKVFTPNSSVGNQIYKFTYLAAGSGTDKAYNLYAGNVKAKGLVVAIDENKNVALAYYDKTYTAFEESLIQYEISYLAEYKNEQMVSLKTIYSQHLSDANHGVFTITIPSDINTRKLFFVDEYWQPKATFVF